MSYAESFPISFLQSQPSRSKKKKIKKKYNIFLNPTFRFIQIANMNDNNKKSSIDESLISDNDLMQMALRRGLSILLPTGATTSASENPAPPPADVAPPAEATAATLPKEAAANLESMAEAAAVDVSSGIQQSNPIAVDSSSSSGYDEEDARNELDEDYIPDANSSDSSDDNNNAIVDNNAIADDNHNEDNPDSDNINNNNHDDNNGDDDEASDSNYSPDSNNNDAVDESDDNNNNNVESDEAQAAKAATKPSDVGYHPRYDKLRMPEGGPPPFLLHPPAAKFASLPTTKKPPTASVPQEDAASCDNEQNNNGNDVPSDATSSDNNNIQNFVYDVVQEVNVPTRYFKLHQPTLEQEEKREQAEQPSTPSRNKQVQGIITGTPKSSSHPPQLAVVPPPSNQRRPITSYSFRDFFDWKHTRFPSGLFGIVDTDGYVWDCDACNKPPEAPRTGHVSYCPMNNNNKHRYRDWVVNRPFSQSDLKHKYVAINPKLPDRVDFANTKQFYRLTCARQKVESESTPSQPKDDTVPTVPVTRSKTRAQKRDHDEEEAVLHPNLGSPDSQQERRPTKKQRITSLPQSPEPSRAKKIPASNLKPPPPTSPIASRRTPSTPQKATPQKATPLQSSFLMPSPQMLHVPKTESQHGKYNQNLKQWYQNTLAPLSKIPSFVERLELLTNLANTMGQDSHFGKFPRQKWTDGIRKDPNPNIYALRLLFILICSKRARDQSLETLHGLVNRDDFSSDFVLSMTVEGLADAIRGIGFQNINANAIYVCFLQIQTSFGGIVPHTVRSLMLLKGVGSKIACLVTQFAFDSVQVSVPMLSIGMP